MSIENNVKRLKDALLARIYGHSYLRPAGLIDALASDTGESVITVRQCLARLAKERWIDGVSNDGVPFRQVRIIGAIPEKRIEPAQERWQAALQRMQGLSDDDANALAPLWRKLAEFDDSELEDVIAGLLHLRTRQADESGRHRFIVSAKFLLGSSKLLDELASPALRSFGINADQFPSHPYYVVVAGPEAPEAVILVENPAALELAIKTNAGDRCAFVATFGFGLGRQKEDYGNQLADIVDDRFANTITLSREGSRCPSARELLAHPAITFWGDLDVAGIQIYRRLQKSIPGLRLSALYEPMIASSTDPRQSHRYLSAVGKSGQADVSGTCGEDDPTVRELLRLCASRGVDQEHVLPGDIGHLAGRPLDLSGGNQAWGD